MLKFEDGSDWLQKRIDGVIKAYKIPDIFTGSNGIAVDVGANVGGFPIVNNKKFNRIICIEPSKYSYNECMNNIKEFDNVEVHNLAVGKVSNELVKLMSFKGGNFSGNASTTKSNSWDENDFEMIKTISLEDIFERFNLSNIDYLKVDCEGGEYDFLMDKILTNINYLGVELHIHLGNKMKILEEYLNEYFIPISQYGDGITVHKEITYKNKLL